MKQIITKKHGEIKKSRLKAINQSEQKVICLEIATDTKKYSCKGMASNNCDQRGGW